LRRSGRDWPAPRPVDAARADLGHNRLWFEEDAFLRYIKEQVNPARVAEGLEPTPACFFTSSWSGTSDFGGFRTIWTTEVMPILYQDQIKRDDLRAHPDRIYLFGDNVARQGRGGQAKEMRGEPNALGIAYGVLG